MFLSVVFLSCHDPPFMCSCRLSAINDIMKWLVNRLCEHIAADSGFPNLAYAEYSTRCALAVSLHLCDFCYTLATSASAFSSSSFSLAATTEFRRVFSILGVCPSNDRDWKSWFLSPPQPAQAIQTARRQVFTYYSQFLDAVPPSPGASASAAAAGSEFHTGLFVEGDFVSESWTYLFTVQNVPAEKRRCFRSLVLQRSGLP